MSQARATNHHGRSLRRLLNTDDSRLELHEDVAPENVVDTLTRSVARAGTPEALETLEFIKELAREDDAQRDVAVSLLSEALAPYLRGSQQQGGRATASEVLNLIKTLAPYDQLNDYLRQIRHAALLLRRYPKTTVGGPSVCRSAIRGVLHRLDHYVLPQLRSRPDALAFVLPTAEDWVGWESMAIAESDHEFLEHVRDLTHAGLERPLLVLLAMLGSHLRQQSDSVDRAILPGLLAIGLRHLKASLAARSQSTAFELAAVIFSSLHFNPSDYSISRGRLRRQPYEFERYQHWFNSCLVEIRERHGLRDAPEILRSAIRQFPQLLGPIGGDLPLALQFADKSSKYAEQSGQQLLERLADVIERKSATDGGAVGALSPSIWSFVGGADSVSQEFLRMRNHTVPRFQLRLLKQIRDSLVSDSIL